MRLKHCSADRFFTKFVLEICGIDVVQIRMSGRRPFDGSSVHFQTQAHLQCRCLCMRHIAFRSHLSLASVVHICRSHLRKCHTCSACKCYRHVLPCMSILTIWVCVVLLDYNIRVYACRSLLHVHHMSDLITRRGWCLLVGTSLQLNNAYHFCVRVFCGT